VNTFSTLINSASGYLKWSDDIFEAIEVDGEGTETGKRIRITPGGIGVSLNGGITYETAITAGQIFVSDSFIVASLDGFTRLIGNGLQVFDDEGIKRLHAGQYLTGKFGLALWNKTGDTIILDEDGIMQTWQEGRTDNVQSGYPLVLNLYLPSETQSIKRAILRFKRMAFRAYSTGAASGGGHTTPSGGGGTSGA